MPRYMTQFAYTADAWATLTKNPANRAEPLGALIEKLGGRLIDLYYCFGDYDGVVLFEAPDDVSATSVILAATAPGHVKSIKTTRLLSVDETMEAMQKAGGGSYPRPSR
jgi:uncharacterized protein with GYD domain